MSFVPTDLTWDINPKNGVGLPLSITIDGYLTAQDMDNEILDDETIVLQIDWGGGDYHDTMLSMITGYNPDTGRHGYFSGVVALTAEGGDGIWVYAPGTYYFRLNYIGNSSKRMGGVASSIISVTDTPPPMIGVTLQFEIGHINANSKAYIYGLRQLDKSTGIWYDIFPEAQQGYCHEGAWMTVTFGVQNTGTVAGTLYCKVTNLTTGVVIVNEQFYLTVNGQHVVSVDIRMPLINTPIS